MATTTTVTARPPGSPDDLYERDFHAWCLAQAQVLRERDFAALDCANVIEELETLGRADRNALRSSWRVLLIHLLKWQFQPERRSRSWLLTIYRERKNIADCEAESPTLKSMADGLVAQAYARARPEAAIEMSRAVIDLPESCPFTLEFLRDAAAYPGPEPSEAIAELIEKSTDRRSAP